MDALQDELKLLKRGVFYSASACTARINELTDYLESYCSENRLQIARVCFHRNMESPLMVMLIVTVGFYMYPPHRHLNKFESYQVVKGKCRFVEYDEKGIDKLSFILGKDQLLLNESTSYHTLMPLTSVLAFIEHTTGPFEEGKNDFLA